MLFRTPSQNVRKVIPTNVCIKGWIVYLCKYGVLDCSCKTLLKLSRIVGWPVVV